MSEVTYGRLDEVLRSLGFSFRGVVEDNNVYWHEPSGAMIVFPVFPPDKQVLDRHLGMTRGTLSAYGIADPLAFDEQLRQAS